MKRVVIAVGLIGLLGGCAGNAPDSSWLVDRAKTAPKACAPLSQDQELALNLAQQTTEEGRLHAALANLERLPSSLPEARLHKARILRTLNRPEAKGLYASLVDTCLRAQGEHGLGQLASTDKHYDEALVRMRRAASLDPTSAAIRNDLGVVYMNLGRMEEARFELLTAIELNEAERQSGLNLLTLLIYQQNLTQASALVKRMSFSPSQYRAAGERAQALRRQLGQTAAVATSAGERPVPARPAASAPAPVAPAGVIQVPQVSAPLALPAQARPAPVAVAQPTAAGAVTRASSVPTTPVTPAAPVAPVVPGVTRAPTVSSAPVAIEMREGRLIVPADGGDVRVEATTH
ncbi:tetratricopeptide repeat protein [Phytopseudomonas daroniae]|uniref:tetratricopeptide repeat protein n=1 Tax=Phytopseudomonas daroniae TaxID=2487519 RepID=UPI001ABFCB92|nr:tetratricopeptide repeat protein [Pseudomonas daroniae]